MDLEKFKKKEYGRTLCVQFECERCNKTTCKPLAECIITDGLVDYEIHDLSETIPPKGWNYGGKFGYLLCPECKQKFEAFMKGGPVD